MPRERLTEIIEEIPLDTSLSVFKRLSRLNRRPPSLRRSKWFENFRRTKGLRKPVEIKPPSKVGRYLIGTKLGSFPGKARRDSFSLGDPYWSKVFSDKWALQGFAGILGDLRPEEWRFLNIWYPYLCEVKDNCLETRLTRLKPSDIFPPDLVTYGDVQRACYKLHSKENKGVDICLARVERVDGGERNPVLLLWHRIDPEIPDFLKGSVYIEWFGPGRLKQEVLFRFFSLLGGG